MLATFLGELRLMCLEIPRKVSLLVRTGMNIEDASSIYLAEKAAQTHDWLPSFHPEEVPGGGDL